ncbi:MAG TPA: ThuA domain-containing protein [Oscillospiraceae bacterium]|nr:ThuA domain-containing protein [Oscillospiraceae bacterium]HPF55677.1 ThuA domain-containing protein [Clostridiales bacterium]HPK35141.1 ThuA domain-containing protein [Oscillospiraceae bacterium]HPR74944.1 ThuA domain-containing protein [Oscillospiraceae bacterium]
MNVTIFVEDDKANTQPEVLEVYKDGIAAELATIFKSGKVRTVSSFEPECGLTQEVLDDTDVLLWWGHRFHGNVPDEVAKRVVNAVLSGMGLIALHSSHYSKPFKTLMGTTCSLRWREGDFERLWITSPSHPIAKGLPDYIELEKEEMYGEYFDIPAPDEIVGMGWFRGGEVFRSVCAFRRGLGKVVYIQPGHETNPTYKNKNIRKLIHNAASWAAEGTRAAAPTGSRHCPVPLEQKQ